MSLDLRYPVGRFAPPATYSAEVRAGFIQAIAGAPAALRASVRGLDDAQLDTPYRPDGWTVRQVVHHVPDSHMNAYIRCKLALTESVPTIKPYDEEAWAGLPDARGAIEGSLALLEALHSRWVALIRSTPPADLAREYVHPETGRHSLDYLLANYAWHGQHHVAHITNLRERMGF